MISIDLRVLSEQENSQAFVQEAILKNDGKLILIVPLDSVNKAGEHRSIAEDYLIASYIGDKIAELSSKISFRTEWKDKYYPEIHFDIVTFNPAQLAAKITEFIPYYPSDTVSEEQTNAAWEKLYEYEDSLEKLSFNFPELIDDYYANQVVGVYVEQDYLNDEQFFGTFKKYPERKFGFWKSALSQKVGYTFYVSTESWIVPNESLNSIYEYLKVDPSRFVLAQFLAINYHYLLVNERFVSLLPYRQLIEAAKCTGTIEDNTPMLHKQDDWLESLYTDPEIAAYRESSDKGWNESIRRLTYWVYDSGDLLVVKDDKYSYILFSARILKHHELTPVLNAVKIMSETISSISGATENIKCDWSKIDDESFEQLCYDFLYYNCKYDNTTIRKMGRSRSRDGGRDIVVEKRKMPGGFGQKKIIFQCKLVKGSKSLSSSKVVGISDVIDQYGANGYGIMTNVHIDSTLYDKVDGIGKNRNIEVDCKSVFEIERFLSAYPDIRKRYFLK